MNFEHMLGTETASNYRAGGVQTTVRYGIARQGDIATTSSVSDLAVQGNGFFVVKTHDGTTALTRAGAFTPDASGNLVHADGCTLLGYSAKGSGGLEPVTLPNAASSVNIGTNGVVSVVDASGASASTYRIPLATVQSPDDMTPLDSDIFEPNATSGAMTIGSANTGDLGQIQSSSLESSTVDVATQLTNMIVAQRGYEANSKVMTISSDMLSKLFDAAS